MVSVRKSHQMSETSFEQWLVALELSPAKHSALEALWNKVNNFFAEQLECQNKSLEMVEILASLNLDKDSLCAAFLITLHEYNCISIEYIEDNFSKAVLLLCKGVKQMDAIKALQQTQSNQVAVNQVDNIRRMLL